MCTDARAKGDPHGVLEGGDSAGASTEYLWMSAQWAFAFIHRRMSVSGGILHRITDER